MAESASLIAGVPVAFSMLSAYHNQLLLIGSLLSGKDPRRDGSTLRPYPDSFARKCMAKSYRVTELLQSVDQEHSNSHLAVYPYSAPCSASLHRSWRTYWVSDAGRLNGRAASKSCRRLRTCTYDLGTRPLVTSRAEGPDWHMPSRCHTTAAVPCVCRLPLSN